MPFLYLAISKLKYCVSFFDTITSLESPKYVVKAEILQLLIEDRPKAYFAPEIFHIAYAEIDAL
jgi:hypothetical protein